MVADPSLTQIRSTSFCGLLIQLHTSMATRQPRVDGRIGDLGGPGVGMSGCLVNHIYQGYPFRDSIGDLLFDTLRYQVKSVKSSEKLLWEMFVSLFVA